MATPLCRGVRASIAYGALEMGIKKVTPLQQRAVEATLRGSSPLFIGDQPGQGKTLAYLLGVFEDSKRAEDIAGGNRLARTAVSLRDSPRALVLAPSRELVNQVYGVAKKLAHSAKLRVRKFAAGTDSQLMESLRGSDVLVCSPWVARKLSQGNRSVNQMIMSRVKQIVLDECDTLLDPRAGFLPEVDALLQMTKPGVQLICVSATIKGHALEYMKRRFGDTTLITSENLHKPLPRLETRDVTVGNRDKIEVLIGEIWRDKETGARESSLIFCNTVDSCRAVQRALSEARIDCIELHGQVPKPLRKTHFDQFRNAKVPILVTTDLASRGLDMPFVRHVMMFDYPMDVTTYIHRVGRLRTPFGRQSGTVTALLQKRDRVLSESIKRAAADGEHIHRASASLSTNIAQMKAREDESNDWKRRRARKIRVYFPSRYPRRNANDSVSSGEFRRPSYKSGPSSPDIDVSHARKQFMHPRPNRCSSAAGSSSKPRRPARRGGSRFEPIEGSQRTERARRQSKHSYQERTDGVKAWSSNRKGLTARTTPRREVRRSKVMR